MLVSNGMILLGLGLLVRSHFTIHRMTTDFGSLNSVRCINWLLEGLYSNTGIFIKEPGGLPIVRQLPRLIIFASQPNGVIPFWMLDLVELQTSVLIITWLTALSGSNWR